VADLGEAVYEFAKLFGGVEDDKRPPAFGTGKGEWVHRPIEHRDWYNHCVGDGPGIGVGPLRTDSTCWFAAIDLDEPDFLAAAEMADYLPGASWIERSRSGNAHVWVFFRTPIAAWIPMGILKEATIAAGKQHVEVFPKNHDFSRVKYGNYINLPYHGDERPCIDGEGDIPFMTFVMGAQAALNDPDEWKKRARWLMLDHPDNRRSGQEFGTQQQLHICAEHIIAHRDDNPVVEGHRNAVYFALAKCLSNCEAFDHDEALEMMELVNDASPDPAPVNELKRLLRNAERGRYTSTGCDDPLVLPYTHPDCRIAHP
jgi:TOTE conflict system primase-like protein